MTRVVSIFTRKDKFNMKTLLIQYPRAASTEDLAAKAGTAEADDQMFPGDSV